MQASTQLKSNENSDFDDHLTGLETVTLKDQAAGGTAWKYKTNTQRI